MALRYENIYIEKKRESVLPLKEIHHRSELVSSRFSSDQTPKAVSAKKTLNNALTFVSARARTHTHLNELESGGSIHFFNL